MLIFQILKSFRYLQIKHPHKWRVDWLIPAIFAAAALYWSHSYIGVHLISAPNGFADRMLSFLQTLPGFYIAALAIITTLRNPRLDKIMDGIPPEIRVLQRGKKNTIQLSRRRFMALLFSFLTALSLSAVVFSIAYISAHNLLIDKEPDFFTYSDIAKYMIGYTYFFMVFQLFIVTLWGLYFLGQKLHDFD